ncbi:MAG: 3-deoxy-8-phosphooctulonate synthase [Candidatus Marinimicrobia bacterium]|jgi:2-dehydro-3-deoxyphosphooctonate aldolase (KDO 8-P synthase)|nr:3-deoxy-8-phosphooctulonate synthase [Candidatus Neomarinimicrobiota bacterium]
MSNIINAGSVSFGGDALPIIAGPCVIESREHTLAMADAIANVCSKTDVPLVFKSSFDKANRTSGDSFRGPGLDEGLSILSAVKESIGIPVLTDIHHPDQAAVVAEVADILQIPAFLCRQTDLIEAVAKTGKTVNVKKGQFLSPWKVGSIVSKIEDAGGNQILLTDRGTTFGYESLISDIRSIPVMKKTGYPVIFDATHSSQMPGTGSSNTGGSREFIPTMVKAATAAGADGIFMEVHDNVEAAKSDAATQWPLDQLEELLMSIKRIREAVCG